MYESFLKYQILLCHYVQENLKVAEPLWVQLSEHFSAARVMDVFLPAVGAFNHQLLVRLVCSLGALNALTSLVKWFSPEYRPYWWMGEMAENQNLSGFDLRQHHLTCETTAGFPSSHTMCFTTVFYMLSLFAFSSGFRFFQCTRKYLDKICCMIAVTASFAMSLSRFYLATQFLHQCIMTSILAITLLYFLDKHAHFLQSLSTIKAAGGVLTFACVPVMVYFAMLHSDVDPHWSVRMAFKWCKDPSYLRHESSPIFVLSRDFGFLMGIALSAPLYRKYNCSKSLKNRILCIVVIESLNHYARQATPKSRGRLVFISYECIRNLLHSYSLLAVMSR